MVALGLVAVLCGLLFKIGAVPAHFWVPDVTDGTPAPVAAYVTTLLPATTCAGSPPSSAPPPATSAPKPRPPSAAGPPQPPTPPAPPPSPSASRGRCDHPGLVQPYCLACQPGGGVGLPNRHSW
ncbi:proton-conducting transporter membrane subunit [Streptomyces sp. TRM72054]|uniref:proton-conducting transporter transmembrane domain-containing protein n=1 Tax=Streptomyces sp. TRM72054 TaxID=2870562 RepID=UPI0027E066EC|nr:proton-conducting transporter membrane subunit [Streptomyces sp. TRM72054]